MRARKASLALPVAILVAIHLAAALAGFLAPYDPTEQFRDHPFRPPTPLRFASPDGGARLWPGVYAPAEGGPGELREERGRLYPVRLLVRGDGGLRLFGVEEPARLFLLGTDGLGRDQLSRLLHGARISLAAGLLAALASLGVGALLGTVSGFYGGRTDAVIMRTAEIFMALPWLYLVLAARAFLPLTISPAAAFLMVVGVIGLVGWAQPARLVRGVVLAGRELDFVTAARGLGAGQGRLILRHALPQAAPVILTQAALLVPLYILGEVTLSFLGLGVTEPTPSWGNMLGDLRHYHILTSYWWMFLPTLALVAVFVAYQLLARGLGAEDS